MKCSICSGNMKPLFTSWYCDACDNRDKKITVSSSEEIFERFCIKWRTTLLKSGEEIPAWATRAWVVNSHPGSDPLKFLRTNRGSKWSVPDVSWELASSVEFLDKWAAGTYESVRLFGEVTS